jgi:hypothetical protein
MKRANFTYWNTLRAKSVAKSQAKKKLKPRKPIRKRSIKRAKQERVYEKNKAEYFETVEHCEFPSCEVTNVTLHHMSGRCGDLLTDKSKFKALCWVHHQYCEENPLIAKELGLSLNRL